MLTLEVLPSTESVYEPELFRATSFIVLVIIFLTDFIDTCIPVLIV